MGRHGYVKLRRLGGVPLRRRWASFETSLRRRGNVLMGLRCYLILRCRQDVPIRCPEDVPQRSLDDITPRRRWWFHLRCTWDVAGTCRETSLWRHNNVLLPVGKTDHEILHSSRHTNLMPIESSSDTKNTIKTYSSKEENPLQQPLPLQLQQLHQLHSEHPKVNAFRTITLLSFWSQVIWEQWMSSWQ